ncbi:MAG: M55 family metallopeptidase [Veillonella sp.]|uniref:M55 family metallopeptidase n=1 Tax=Veillonella sp. TaxID=1926307 RepID=UPI0025D8FD8F|nr:M55 family metallopeptidase [Veillonella sp.]MBS4913492.1 M55 family metallopeptidase [Veillonella sp.]
MKLFISADIEGCAGWAFREEGHVGEPSYEYMRQQMTREVLAACEAAHAHGATEIVVKDGHGAANNIDPLALPGYVTLIRGKSGHPYNMMYGLDSTFDGVAYIGYHAGAGDVHFNGSHTSTGNSLYIRLNGKAMSEYMLNTYTALSMGVVPLFISGDAAICKQAEKLVPHVVTNVTKDGVGGATFCKSVDTVMDGIRSGIGEALKRWDDAQKSKKPLNRSVTLPNEFIYEVTFKDWHQAYKMSFYPRMEQVNDFTIRLISNSWLDIVTAHSFVVY